MHISVHAMLKMLKIAPSHNGEESFKKFWNPDPDPDHFQGGPSHGHSPSITSCCYVTDRILGNSAAAAQP